MIRDPSTPTPTVWSRVAAPPGLTSVPTQAVSDSALPTERRATRAAVWIVGAVAAAAAIIGVSCYDSLDRARQLAGAGADYLAFGAFFPSPTKPLARHAHTDLLHDAKALGLQ